MRRLAAFTLVEAILYLALFNVVFFSVITFTITLTQNNRSAEYKNAVEKNSIFITEHLKDTFNEGITINEAETDYGSTIGKIRVNQNSGYKEYAVVADKLILSTGSATVDLTDSLVKVTSFLIEPVYDSADVAIGARISLTLVAQKYPDTITKTVQSYYAFR